MNADATAGGRLSRIDGPRKRLAPAGLRDGRKGDEGATLYEVARSSSPWVEPCASVTTPNAETSSGGDLFHYLNRPLAPNVDRWGQDSPGIERTVDCTPCPAPACY